MDPETPHKTRDTESYRRESVEDPQIYRHRGKIPEQNDNGLCCKNKSQQVRPQNSNASVRQKTLSIRQKGSLEIGKRSLSIQI